MGGGGTDLPAYASKYGGFVISAAIDKYVYIYANRPFNDDSIRLKYSKSEQVDSLGEVQHDLARIALQRMEVTQNIELAWMADISEGSGLGSSGAFLVAMVQSLLALKKTPTTPYQVASHAYKIEGELAGHPVGPQDHFVSAFGGGIILTIGSDGRIESKTLGGNHDIRYGVEVETLSAGLKRLQDHLLLFDTGIRRSSRDPLWSQETDTKREDPQVLDSLHRTKEMGYRAKELLERGDVEGYGKLLDAHWQAKKQRRGITNPAIDSWYSLALDYGAWGGKVVGAGGGGFLLFALAPADQQELIEALTICGLKHLPFQFASRGVEVVAKS